MPLSTGSDQSRLETFAANASPAAPCVAGRASVDECVCDFEQTLMIGERGFDFGVLRQDGDVRRAQSLGSLALRQAVIVDALLRHDSRCFLRQRRAAIVGAGIDSLAHAASHIRAITRTQQQASHCGLKASPVLIAFESSRCNLKIAAHRCWVRRASCRVSNPAVAFRTGGRCPVMKVSNMAFGIVRPRGQACVTQRFAS